ncbi:MAG: LysM peptidoglycan-binding domain-containing protein, partial [bacterium]
GGDGAEVIYALRNKDTLSESIAEGFISVGQNYRSSYQRRLPSDSSLDYYFMHRNTPDNETVIVEYGFLDSSGDDVDLIKNDWKTLTEGVLMALVPYVGGTYVPLDFDYIHIVVAGDTLYSIAVKYNTTVDEIKSINNIINNNIYLGQRIYLPGINSSIPDNETDFYIVQSGDTLYSISIKLGVNIDDIRKINNLTNDVLSVGQILYFKKIEEENPLVHIVEVGDTLYSISAKYNISVAYLRDINNLTSDILSIGQVLKLIDTDYEDDLDDNMLDDNIYVVQSGDTLYSISIKVGLSVDELKSINKLTSDTLSVGQVLYLVLENVYDTYIVKSGDTLYSIAKMFNTTYSNIMEINNLESNLLSVGQTINVPFLETSYTEYTVKSGDSLYKISNTFNISVSDLKSLNNITSDILSIGQILLIPIN